MGEKQERAKRGMKALREAKAKNKHPFTGRRRQLQPADIPINIEKGLGKLISKEERQDKVKELLRRGVPPKLIAQHLQVSERTVRRDKQEIKKRIRQEAIEADQWEMIGDTIDFFKEIEEKALYQAMIEKNSSFKNSFMNTAIKARIESARFKLETGVISRASDKKEISIQVNGVNIEKMTTEELLEHKKALLKKLDQKSLPNDIIDGEIVKRD